MSPRQPIPELFRSAPGWTDGSGCLSRRDFIRWGVPAAVAVSGFSLLRPGLTRRGLVWAGTVSMTETASIVKVAYYTELLAHLHYIAFSRIALTENLPNIAYLFTAFSVSELVHALKFKDVVARLGIPIEETEPLQLDVASTKTNLQVAAERELEKIEATYPQFLEKIRPEGDEESIRYCMYAWESHKQHRDQIEKIKRWSERFFGMVSRKLEKQSVRYFVCGDCGSTVIKVPEDNCHICRHHVERYTEVPRPA